MTENKFSTAQLYSQNILKKVSFLVLLSILLFALVLGSLCIGASSTGFIQAVKLFFSFLPFFGHVDMDAVIIIMDLRLPRVLMAVIAGFGLGVSGVVMQGLLRNPLVSPYTLGVSSGAACGAAFFIVYGFNFAVIMKFSMILTAFVFSITSIFVVYLIAGLKATSSETLILAGIAISYLFSALISSFKYFSSSEDLREIVFWILGSLQAIKIEDVYIVFPVISAASIFLYRLSWDLNIMGAGEDVAKSLGVNTKILRFLGLLLSALITASIISFTGIIGFIGLMAPHFCRLLFGHDHRFLFPGAGLIGSILLLASDTVSRIIMAPTEIPIGITTAFIGIPFFLFLLISRRRRKWQQN